MDHFVLEEMTLTTFLLPEVLNEKLRYWHKIKIPYPVSYKVKDFHYIIYEQTIEQ